jgi:AraC-like DNA-binding protein
MTSHALSALEAFPAEPRQRAACLDQAAVFQHPLLEEPPTSAATASERRDHRRLEQHAAESCRRCPLLADCLYDAVVRHDVAGYAGGTTARERARIRSALGIVVTPENLDTLAGVTGGSRPVDHDEVIRLRAANPDESLERLAQRLGCSLSTIKRHLRRERSGQAPVRTGVRPMPSTAEVLLAASRVLDGERPQKNAA